MADPSPLPTPDDLAAACACDGPAGEALRGLLLRHGGDRADAQAALARAAAEVPAAALLLWQDGATDDLAPLAGRPGALLAAGADALLARGDARRAARALEAALSGPPDVACLASRLLELAYVSAGRHADAARLVDERPGEGAAPPALRRAEHLRRAGDERAAQAYMALLMERPDAYALASLEALFGARRDAQALAALYAEAARRETAPAVRALHRHRLGEALEALGRAEEAAQAFRGAQDGEALAGVPRERWSRAVPDGADWRGRAEALRQEARALPDTARAAALLLVAGRTALEQGGGEAIAWLEEARACARGDRRPDELLAHGLLAAGDLTGLAGLHCGPVAAVLARSPYPGAAPPECAFSAADAAGDRLGLSLACRAWADALGEGPEAGILRTAAACLAPSDVAARDLLARAAQAAPGLLAARLCQVRAAARAGRLRDVREAAEAAAGRLPDGPLRQALLRQADEASEALGDVLVEAPAAPPPGPPARIRGKARKKALGRAEEQLQWGLGDSDAAAAAAAICEAAATFLSCGDGARAAQAWRQALDRAPRAVAALMGLAGDAEARGERADAAVLYERAWAAAGDDGRGTARTALSALDRLYDRLGRDEPRRAALERLYAASEDEEDRRALRPALVRLREEAGEPAAAADLLRGALHAMPAAPAELRRLSELSAKAGRRGDEAAALEALARCLRDPAERSRLYLRAARVYRTHLGGGAVLRENAMLAFMCDNDNREAFDLLESLYVEEGRWQEVAGIYDLALSRARRGGPYSVATLLRARGLVEARRLDRPAEAVATLLAALEADPSDGQTAAALDALVTATGAPGVRVRMLEIQGAALPAPARAERLALAAAICEEAGDHGRAAELLARARALLPDDTALAERLRGVLDAAQDWRELAALDLELADRAPDGPASAASLLRAATALERAGDMGRALAALERAGQCAPRDREVLARLSRLCHATKAWDRLLEVSARELEFEESPRERARIRFRMGSLQETALGDDTGAAESFRQAIEHDPACVPALHGLREICLRRGDWAGAQDALLREVDAWDAPDRRAALRVRVAELRQEELGDPVGALAAWEEALAEAPDHLAALRGIVPALLDAARWADALALAERLSAREEAAGDPEGRAQAQVLRARAALGLRSPAACADALVRAFALVPGHEEARRRLDELADSGDIVGLPRAVLDDLLRAAQATADGAGGGDGAWALLLRGRVAEADTAPDAAEGLYRQALAASPTSPGPRRALAGILRRRRRWGEAAAVLEGAADAGAAGWIGFVLDAADVRLDRLDDADGAWALYDRARLALRGSAAEGAGADLLRRALLGLAHAERRTGRAVAAARRLEAVVAMDGAPTGGEGGGAGSATHWRLLGLARAEAGDGAGALAALRGAAQRSPGDPDTALALSRLLWEGDPEEALRVLAGAAGAARPDGAQRIARGRAGRLRRAGRTDEAIAVLEAAAAAAGDPTETLCALAALEAEAPPDGEVRALRRLRARVAEDPARAEPWGGLAAVHRRAGQDDARFLAESVQCALAPAAARRERLAVPAREAAMRAERPGVLTLALLDEEVLHPDARQPLWTLWPIAADYLARVYPPAPAPPATHPAARRIDPGVAGSPVARAFASVARLVGAPGDTEVWVTGDSDAVTAAPGAPPRLLVGACWARDDADEGALRFLLARAAALLGGERSLAAGPLGVALPAARLVAALFREAVDPEGPADGRTPNPADLPRRLVGPARERLAADVRWSERTPAPDVFVEGVRRTAMRVGLLAAGDPRAAFAALLGPEAAGHPRRVAGAVRDRDELADLVRWMAGDAIGRARRALGLSLGGSSA